MLSLTLRSSAWILPAPEETARMALLHSSAVAVLPPKLNWLLGNCSVSMADWWSVVLCPCSTSVKSNYTSGLLSSTTWTRHFWLSPLLNITLFLHSLSFDISLIHGKLLWDMVRKGHSIAFLIAQPKWKVCLHLLTTMQWKLDGVSHCRAPKRTKDQHKSSLYDLYIIIHIK